MKGRVIRFYLQTFCLLAGKLCNKNEMDYLVPSEELWDFQLDRIYLRGDANIIKKPNFINRTEGIVTAVNGQRRGGVWALNSWIVPPPCTVLLTANIITIKN